MKVNLIIFPKETETSRTRETRMKYLDINTVIVDRQDYGTLLADLVANAEKKKEDVVIVCKNEGLLGKIDPPLFLELINEAFTYNTKILLFNTDHSFSLLPISPNFFWIDHFSGCELMVIYKSFYDSVCSMGNVEYNLVEKTLSEMTSNKLLVYPIIFNQSPSLSRLTSRMDRLMEQKKRLDPFSCRLNVK